MSEIVDCITWVVQKTCWSFYVFTEFVFLRILDLLGLVFNTLACLTVIRFPCMIGQFSTMKKLSEWRYVGFVQLMIFLMDIPFILMGLAAIFSSFGLLYFRMIRKVREKNIKCDYTHQNSQGIFFGGFGLRRLVARYFFIHMSGLLCIPLLLMTLVSWRSLILVRKLRPHSYFDWQWRKKILIQFLELFIDVPCVFVTVFVVLSWRLPFYIRNVKKVREEERGWSMWRFVAFKHFLLLFVDLFCFILFLVTFITWRSPFMIAKLRNDCDNQWEARETVIKQFLLMFVDVPCIICFIFVLVTLWRLPRFVENYKNDEWEIRRNCVCQAGMLFLDFGCFLLFSLIAVTLWRLYPFIRDMLKYRRRAQRSDTETVDTNTTSRQIEENLVSSASSWKIRKAACKHFGLLLVDLPAIALLFFITVTLFRVPSLVSKLLQSGDFYAEFAMTVFTEAGKLLIDVLFLLFFVILMIIRPIASWVRLLEDEEHTQYRRVRFYTKWIPDMISDTKARLPVAMDEVFSSCLKARMPAVDARMRMSVVCLEYLKQWEWLLGKVHDDDLYPELQHLIKTLLWYEKRRPYKMSRLYCCELLYLSKPVPSAHDESLSRHKREMAAFQDRLASAYRELENFSPEKVPLWRNKCGLLARTRRETQKVLVGLPGGNILLFLLLLVNLLLIYRGPRLLLDLYRRWYDRHSILFRSCKEYLLDGLTFLRIIIVLLFVYRAPSLLLDIAIDIFQKQSWQAVRKTAKRYPPEILEDFARLLSKVLHWRSVRFLFTAILFGFLIPADLLLTVLKLAVSKCAAYLITGVLFSAFLFFPFAFSFYFGEELLVAGFGMKITYIIGGFCLSVVVLLALLIVILLKQRGTMFSVAPKPYDYVRLNWANAHVIVFEIVELLQLVALVFSIDGIPIMGSGVLNTYANYLLFNFASFEVKLSLTIIGFLVWFIVCGAPVIFEHILEDFPKGTCAANDGWRMLMVLLYNTFFVSIVEGLCGLTACDYVNICNNNATLQANNSTCYVSSLFDDTTTMCWVGEHRVIALFGLWGLFWYTTTAIIYGTQYGEVDSANVDIEFSPVYNTVINFLKAIMVGAVVLIPKDFYLVMSCLLVLSLVAILITIFFRKTIGYDLCNSTVMSYVRVASFVVFAVTVVAAVVAKKLNDEASYIPLAIFFGGGGVTLIVALAVGLLRRKETATEKVRKQFRQTLLALEKRLRRDGLLVHSWKEQKRKWQRLVRHVYEAQALDRNVNPETWEVIPLPEVNVCSVTPVEHPPPPPIDPCGTSFDPPILPQEQALPTHPPPGYTEGTNQPAMSSSILVDKEPPLQLTDPRETSVVEEHQLDTFVGSSTHDRKSADDVATTSEVDEKSSDDDNASADPNILTYSHSTVASDVDAVPLDHDEEYYDANEFVKNVRNQVRSFKEYKSEVTTMASLHCNGKNLLLYLEDFIHFRAFSFAFVSQIPLWRQATSRSNWTGLLHCLQVLDRSLTGTYNKPTELDVSLGDDRVSTCVLVPDPDHGAPPSFVREPRDVESIKRQSDEERERALYDLQRVCADEPIWLSVFDKVLPTIPVIRRWSFDGESKSFELILRRSCQATVVDVGPKGIKLAKGALIVLPKKVKGTLTNQTLTFQKRFEPVGKKGPISVTISEIYITRILEKVYFYSNGKKVNVEKALDSLKSVKWS